MHPTDRGPRASDPPFPSGEGPKTIDMTLEGELLTPPSRWTRLLRLWQALPRGSVPLILAFLAVVTIGALLLVGFLLVAVPVALVLGLLAMLLGPRRLPR